MSTEPVSLALADDCRSLSPAEIDRVVDYVFSHSIESIKGFLKDTELKVSGKKEVLRARVQDAIDNGKTDISALVNLIDTIEGWGNQHVYLYQSPDGETKTWRSEALARKRMATIGQDQLFNRRRPLVLPDEP